MAQIIRVEPVTLAEMLRSHGEDRLADRAASLTDAELTRIGSLGWYYAFSHDALSLGRSMGGTRALSLATLDVLEATGRDLRRHHAGFEDACGAATRGACQCTPDASERARDTALRGCPGRPLA